METPLEKTFSGYNVPDPSLRTNAGDVQAKQRERLLRLKRNWDILFRLRNPPIRLLLPHQRFWMQRIERHPAIQAKLVGEQIFQPVQRLFVLLLVLELVLVVSSSTLTLETCAAMFGRCRTLRPDEKARHGDDPLAAIIKSISVMAFIFLFLHTKTKPDKAL